MSITYAIGDIHGRLDVLDACIERIEQHRAGQPAKTVFLGDYIDRGPNSRGVVDRLIAGSQSDMTWVVLGGNHEDMALLAYHEPETHRGWWVANGGGATLVSYPDKNISGEHLYWMSQLPTIHLDEHRLFVHAGVYAGIPLAEQNADHLRWVRHGRNDEVPLLDGQYVVHGHTPQFDGPVVLETRCNLDTASYKSGRAAIAVFDDSLPGKPVEMLTVTCGYHLGV
jgi:serine/threonine protein phosphatase 1